MQRIFWSQGSHTTELPLITFFLSSEAAMQSRDFCYWLQGFFELSTSPEAISAKQLVTIRRHLELVLGHEPSLGLLKESSEKTERCVPVRPVERTEPPVPKKRDGAEPDPVPLPHDPNNIPEKPRHNPPMC
jgi:hypothetical protein